MLETFADCLNGRDRRTEMRQLVGIMAQLPFLSLKVIVLLDDLALSPLKFCQLNRSGQIGCQQSLALPFQTARRRRHSRSSMLEFFREPGATLRTLHGRHDQLGVLDYLTEILPDERIQSIGRNMAGSTPFITGIAGGSLVTLAAIIIVVGGSEPSVALEPTASATDQVP